MTQSNVKIAITGGIGSGKSVVSDMISKFGYPVFSCDKIYAELLTNKNFIGKIEENFPGTAKDGVLNRQKLSNIVFSDNAALQKLNGLTHTAIMEEAFKKMSSYKLSFLEVPLLFENNFEDKFDSVIVILREESERISAVVKRSGLSEEQVKKRINSQFNYDNYDFAKYYVIHNSGNLDNLRLHLQKILKKIEQEYN